MTIKEFYALNTLIDHAERDMSYGEGGSYNIDGEFDSKSAAQSREAIKYILRILAKKNHQMSALKIRKALASGKISIEV